MPRRLLLLLLLTPLTAHAGPRVSVQETVDKWLARQPLEDVTVGVSVRDGATGEEVAAHGADALLYPASGAKLLTTAAALHTLGPDHRWQTCLKVEEGTVHLVGGGDPALLAPGVEALTARAHQLLADHTLSAVVVHTARHDARRLAPAYHIKETDAGYRPRVGPAGSFHGAITVEVTPHPKPGKNLSATVTPSSSAVVLQVEARSVFERAPDTPELTIRATELPGGRTKIQVSGALLFTDKSRTSTKAVADPDAFTGYLLRDGLRALGHPVTGVGVSVRPTPIIVDDPERDCHQSASLMEATREIHLWSNNFMAEMVLKELSPDEPATWRAGAAQATRALRDLGLREDSFVLVNGSGLYMATRASPRALTGLLHRMLGDEQLGPAYRQSLGLAGGEGWLEHRLRKRSTRGRVRAKTGTLDEVVSLTGLVPTRSGAELLFSIVINDATPKRTRALRRAMDALVTSLSLR